MKVNHRIKSNRFEVVGEPCDFYVFDHYSQNPDCTSGWIKGKSNDYHELKRLSVKDKKSFDLKCETFFK